MTPDQEQQFRKHLAAPLPDGHHEPPDSQEQDLTRAARRHARAHAVGLVSHGHDQAQRHFVAMCKCDPPAQLKRCTDPVSGDCPLHGSFAKRR